MPALVSLDDYNDLCLLLGFNCLFLLVCWIVVYIILNACVYLWVCYLIVCRRVLIVV